PAAGEWAAWGEPPEAARDDTRWFRTTARRPRIFSASSLPTFYLLPSTFYFHLSLRPVRRPVIAAGRDFRQLLAVARNGEDLHLSRTRGCKRQVSAVRREHRAFIAAFAVRQLV